MTQTRTFSSLLRACSLGALMYTLASCDIPKAAAVWIEPLPLQSAKSATARGVAAQRALGPNDRVIVRDGHFYTSGEAGEAGANQRIRFFGVNLALSANFPSADDGEALASRLAELGVNLVRLHAIDQPAGSASANAYPVGILRDATHPELDRQAAAQLKSFITQLSKHGIYVDLNLHVNHTFPASRPGDFIPPQSKPLQIFDDEMIQWQIRYIRNLVAALDLRNTPALAMIEIDNESTLIDNWQEGSLPSLVKGRFLQELETKWAQYRVAHHLSPAPLPLVPRGVSATLAKEAAQFFVDLDASYIDLMTSTVSELIGKTTPIAGTQVAHGGRWRHGGFVNFDVNRSASFIDAHFYVDHYWFPHRQWDWTDWRISNSWLGDAADSTLLNVAYARAAGKPFVISEFNQPWPNQQDSAMLPVVTQLAVAQDWDGLILYNWSHDKNWHVTTPSDFSLKGDWTKLVQFAQCAHYFRAIRPNTAFPRTTISLSTDERMRAATRNVAGAFGSYLSDQHAVPLTLPAHRQIMMADAVAFRVRDEDHSPTSSYLDIDRGEKQIRFGSSYAAGVTGYLPVDQRVSTPILDVTLLPPSRGFATAFLTSVDSEPLAQSSHLLLTLPGFTMGSTRNGPQSLESSGLQGQWQTIAPERGGAPSSNLKDVSGPSQMERIPANVSLRIPSLGASVYPLSFDGTRLAAIPAKVTQTTVTFSVNTKSLPFAASYEIVIQH